MSEVNKNRTAMNALAKKVSKLEKDLAETNQALISLEHRLDDISVENIEALDDSLIRKVG